MTHSDTSSLPWRYLHQPRGERSLTIRHVIRLSTLTYAFQPTVSSTIPYVLLHRIKCTKTELLCKCSYAKYTILNAVCHVTPERSTTNDVTCEHGYMYICITRNEHSKYLIAQFDDVISTKSRMCTFFFPPPGTCDAFSKDPILLSVFHSILRVSIFSKEIERHCEFHLV